MAAGQPRLRALLFGLCPPRRPPRPSQGCQTARQRRPKRRPRVGPKRSLQSAGRGGPRGTEPRRSSDSGADGRRSHAQRHPVEEVEMDGAALGLNSKLQRTKTHTRNAVDISSCEQTRIALGFSLPKASKMRPRWCWHCPIK